MPLLSLDRILQSQGIGSRAECRALIAAGAVAVDGSAATDWRRSFPTEGFTFSVRGAELAFREKVYLALDKPAGYECSRAPGAHFSVFDLLPDWAERRGVQPAGRLDQDTTGLLLLSDDGDFIHAQTSPRRHVPKTYRAETADPVTDAQIAALLGGVFLRGEEERDSALRCGRIGERELELVIDRGKYHQVRRMIAAAGNRCVSLRRTAIGRLTPEGLGLAEGEWRFLEAEELAALR